MEKNEITVQKYGGTSVGSAERIKAVAQHIKTCSQKGKKVIAIVSAMGEETDRIIDLMHSINDNPNPREYSQIVQTGEVVSAGLLALALNKIGIKAKSWTASQAGLITTDDLIHAKIKRVNVRKLKKALNDHVVVLAGFQGIAENSSDITTLGRGGSDATAVAMAAALKADLCEIYTDVDGIFSVDPRIVEGVNRFKEISYAQMISMSNSGAGVMMSRSVKIGMDHNIPIRVLKSPSIGKSDGGTLITSTKTAGTLERINDGPSVGIAIEDISAININNIPNKPGVAEKIYGLLKDTFIVDTAQTGLGDKTANISILLKPEQAKNFLKRLDALKIKGIKISFSDKLTSLNLVDPYMTSESGYMHKIAETMGKSKINIEGSFTAETAIGIVVKQKDKKRAATALAKKFGLIKK